MGREERFSQGPTNRTFLVLVLVTACILLLINLPHTNLSSTTISSMVQLTVQIGITDPPNSFITDSNRDTTSDTTNTSELSPGDGSLHLNPPSQSWMQTQMSHAESMMGLNYYPPNNWKLCEHPMQTYYFPKIRTVFTGVPKSGCSNWIEALLRAEGTLKEPLISTEVYKVHESISSSHRMVKFLRPGSRRVREKFSFTVVRNPWTRMVSGYRDKLSNEKTQGGDKRDIGIEIVREIRGITGPEVYELYPTFLEYLQYLIKHKTTENVHFMPQHKILCFPSAQYDFIVPLEYSSVLDSQVWSHINSSVSLLGSYDHVSDPRQQTSTQRAREWFGNVDKDIIDKLYELYKEDFAMLNYSNFTHPNFPLPLH